MIVLALLDIPGEVLTPIGFGFGIGGAILIGMSIWNRPIDLAHRTEQLPTFLSGIRDRVRIVVGVPFVALGFALQFAGSTWASISTPEDVNAFLAVGSAGLGLLSVALANRILRDKVRARTLRAALQQQDVRTSNLVCNACREYWRDATAAIENAVHDPLVPDDSGMPKDIGLRNAAIVEAVRDRRLPQKGRTGASRSR